MACIFNCGSEVYFMKTFTTKNQTLNQQLIVFISISSGERSSRTPLRDTSHALALGPFHTNNLRPLIIRNELYSISTESFSEIFGFGVGN